MTTREQYKKIYRVIRIHKFDITEISNDKAILSILEVLGYHDIIINASKSYNQRNLTPTHMPTEERFEYVEAWGGHNGLFW